MLKGKLTGWKPVTLQAPVLGGLVLVSLGIIAVLEWFSYKSSSHGNGGAVAFAVEGNGISAAAKFSFLFFPNILAVLYSLIWSWVDLDVKRLEPWFQLSKKHGARDEDSLLLQYPFDFQPLIPILAFRRRHWGVFLAGTIMLLVLWVIIPLQSAIFKTGTVTRSTASNMITSAHLIPLEEQTNVLNANFQNTAYGIAWVNQTMPAFTTLPYSVLPFKPLSGRPKRLSTETWTTAVDAFSTSLLCTPATVEFTPVGYTFSNGRGCSASQITSLGGGDFFVNYIGYYDNAQLDWDLQASNCSMEFSNNFLAIWTSGDLLLPGSEAAELAPGDLTSLFCETQYHVQKYSVTVNASNLAIVDSIPITGSQNKTEINNLQDVFNTTAFEYIIGTGVDPDNPQINLPGRYILDQSFRMKSYNLSLPVNPMVGFAIALNPFSVEDLADPAKLQDAFERAHQLLFATAFSSLLSSTNQSGTLSPDQIRPGIIQDTSGAIVLVRPAAIVVEVTLGIVAIFSTLLWLYSHQRASHLKKDPASIADMMNMLHHNRITPKMFEIDALSKNPSLLNPDPHRFYRPTEKCGSEPVAAPVDLSEGPTLVQGRRKSISSQQHEITPATRPHELRLWIGVSLVFMILLAIAGLLVLNYFSTTENGRNCPLPSRNQYILTILEHYLPTIVATFLGLAWVILNRTLCVLKPFDELGNGNAKSSASIMTKYTSLPPPLVIVRAIRSGHILLAAICLISVSTDLLAASLSAVLNEAATSTSKPSVSQSLYLPILTTTISESGYQTPSGIVSDHFNVLISHITQNNSLPPWLNTNQYFMPFTLKSPPDITMSISPSIVQGFKGSTTGFGANITCTPLSTNGGENSYNFSASGDQTTIFLSTTHRLPDGTSVSCVPSSSKNGISTVWSDDIGNLAMEIMEFMAPAGGDDGGFCSSLMIAGWIRGSSIVGPITGNETTPPVNFQGVSSSTFITCSADFQTAEFDVFVDPSGHILQANRTSGFSPPTFQGDVARADFLSDVTALIAGDGNVQWGGFGWHNVSFTSDLISSVLLLANNSEALVDPASPIPDPNLLAAQLEGIYAQLFAILLALNDKNILAKPETTQEMQIETEVLVTRIFVSAPKFKLSITILVLQLIVAILCYVFRPKKFLSRMPTTIADILGYIDGSRACEDFSDDQNQRKGQNEKERRYALGRFVGTDGRMRVGIERTERVVLLGNKGGEGQELEFVV